MKGHRRTQEEIEHSIPSRVLDVNLAVLENTVRYLWNDIVSWRMRKRNRLPTRLKAQWAYKHICQLRTALQELESIVCVELEETPELMHEVEEELELEQMQQKGGNNDTK